MKIAINSISPTGINFVSVVNELKNTGRNQLHDYCRSQHLDGVIDQNRIISSLDILVTHICISAKKEVCFEIEGSGPCIEMCFYLSTNAIYESADSAEIIRIEKGHHNLFFFPTLPYQNYWPHGEDQELISIIISPELFMRYAPPDKAFLAFMEQIMKGQTSTLFKQSAPITMRIHNLLTEMLKMEVTAELRHMHLESSVIALLTEQFRQFMEVSQGYTQACPGVPTQERERMHHLKLYVDQHITRLFSLRELADQAGTTEYYLKKYFKRCYGISLHHYVQQQRMDLSKKLLMEEGMNINEISTLLNITEPTNFVAAFKKYFGLPPGKFQKQGLHRL